jgi:hypothetical protein
VFKIVKIYFIGLALIIASGCSDDANPNGSGGFILLSGTSGRGNAGSISNGGATAMSTSVGGSVSPGGGGSMPQAGVGGTAAIAGTSGGGGAASGVVGQGGAGGMAGSDGTSVSAGKTIIPARCSGDATKTVMVGDSYLALSGAITGFLRQYSGLSLDRTDYVSGAGMVAGLPPTIPDQYELAKASGKIESVIMDGGGNDVLLGDLTCWIDGYQAGSSCEATVFAAMDAAKGLIKNAASDGVKEAIYFFYPHIGNDVLNGVLDKTLPLAKSLCEDQKDLDCTFIDTRDGYKPEWIEIDGIHPTSEGSEFIANLIWETMQKNCKAGVTDYKSP